MPTGGRPAPRLEREATGPPSTQKRRRGRSLRRRGATRLARSPTALHSRPVARRGAVLELPEREGRAVRYVMRRGSPRHHGKESRHEEAFDLDLRPRRSRRCGRERRLLELVGERRLVDGLVSLYREAGQPARRTTEPGSLRGSRRGWSWTADDRSLRRRLRHEWVAGLERLVRRVRRVRLVRLVRLDVQAPRSVLRHRSGLLQQQLRRVRHAAMPLSVDHGRAGRPPAR